MKKKIVMMLFMLVVVCSTGACGSRGSTPTAEESINQEEFKEIKWPTSEIVQLLPQPKSNIGKIDMEASSAFYVYIGNTSEDEYNLYVDDCMENGFTVDYWRTDDSYYGDNKDGYHVSVDYEGNDVMYISITEPYDTDTEKEENTEEVNKAEKVENTQEKEKGKDTEKDTKKKEKSEKKKISKKKSAKDKSGVSKDFKKMMDSYEAFFDKYVDFMKTYQDSDDAIGMMSDYAEYMKQYADYMEKLDEVNTDDLSAADLAYYTEVQARIMKKLAEIS
jgi:hypothetical protein